MTPDYCVPPPDTDTDGENTSRLPLALRQVVVGIGEFAVSQDPQAEIKTFGLGSCVAVVFLHHPSRTAGLLHVALPSSQINPRLVQERPGYFADTGIAATLNALANASGLDPEHEGWRGLEVKMAGGASVLDPKGIFNIGQRNIAAIRQILDAHGLSPTATDLGGSQSRTVVVSVHSGRVYLRFPGGETLKL